VAYLSGKSRLFLLPGLSFLHCPVLQGEGNPLSARRDVEQQTELPNKLYFRIGEVAKIVGVKPYVLRYWETEFSILKPGKTPSRHRLYRRRDVEMLLEIKTLLYEEGFTIAGAKKKLKESENGREDEKNVPPIAPLEETIAALPQSQDHLELLRAIRDDLRMLYSMLT
jgi:DNA-binding transcriptional MerR regulator